MISFEKYDLSKPLDISIPLRASADNVSAWYVNPPVMEPVVMGDWIGDVSKGGSVNFRNVFFNPHGHGTHTECVGHISKELYSINKCLTTFFFTCAVVTAKPSREGGDAVVELETFPTGWTGKGLEAIAIRTLPNEKTKLSRHYSNQNPPYLSHKLTLFLREQGIRHLLVDLPSVDRESDEGKLLAHKAFWNYPGNARMDATITEFIFIPDEVKDGEYLLNLQIAPFENDASPSKPVLYPLK